MKPEVPVGSHNIRQTVGEHMSDAPSASSLSNRPEPIRTPGKAAKRWAIFFAVVTVAWMATMFASLQWRFLDRFFSFTANGLMGWDFFLRRGQSAIFWPATAFF